jgi:hypothetical protein
MNFKEWLKIQEMGTMSAAVVGGPVAGSGTYSMDVNNPPVPRKLFAGLVARPMIGGVVKEKKKKQKLPPA